MEKYATGVGSSHSYGYGGKKGIQLVNRITIMNSFSTILAIWVLIYSSLVCNNYNKSLNSNGLYNNIYIV